ncbi:putative baseplate assembly protein [Cumulibacter manganitolerans]|uniref:putative baseplate assembly protein n=1 Tax=Cumulibacter manganitolerans TaxID=1884992 RepID=UPI0012968EE0|nr:putative baseplate assembly protein [Cumulibacter manganitolerans]
MTTHPIRSDDALYADLIVRLAGFVPGRVSDGAPAQALLRAYARQLAAVHERLDLVPGKARLAFLDMLGLSLLPARPARAPVRFTLPPGGSDTRAVAGSQVGASVPGLDQPLVFETETTTGLTAARLVEVATVWPGRDGWADHSAAARTGAAFTLFDPLAPVPHELYLAHDTVLALTGAVTVEVVVDLAQPAPVPMPTVWEYWDGTGWRRFKEFVPAARSRSSDSVDGTAGLTRSGTVRLVADCAGSVRRAVAGRVSHWIRARLVSALPPNVAGARPAVDRVQLRTVIAPSMGVIQLAGPDGGIDNRLWIESAGLAAQGLDLTDATASLSDLQDPDSTYPVQSLTAGSVQWDGLDYGSYVLRVAISGYTTLVKTVTHQRGRSNYYLWTDFSGLPLDRAANGGGPVDLSKSMLPFGATPQPGSDFAIAFDQALSKPGAVVTLRQTWADTGTSDTLPTGVAGSDHTPEMVAEYFDGTGWRALEVASDDLVTFCTQVSGGALTFSVPDDIAAVEVAGTTARWIRIRLTSDTFARTLTTTWKDAAGDSHAFRTIEPRPPSWQTLRGGFVYRSPLTGPHACLTHNDFAYEDRTAAALDRGTAFEPFATVRDMTPTLYLGFDRPLPADVISLFLDIAEIPGIASGPALAWEAWTGARWDPVGVRDDTAGLVLPGVVAVTCPGSSPLPVATVVGASQSQALLADEVAASAFRPGDHVLLGSGAELEPVVVDAVHGNALTFTTPLSGSYPRATVSLAGLARFGTPRAAWLRARLRADGEPAPTAIGGIYLNTTWATHSRTVRNEVLGGGSGEPGQSLRARQAPILPGQLLDVRELSGPRAEVERSLLLADVEAGGRPSGDLSIVTDPRTGAAVEVWVRWQERPHLYFSGPGDRHYVVERSQGRITFGDGRHGRVPPAGADNLRLTEYRTGGGAAGNVPAGALTTLMSGIVASAVTNVRAAEGGADGEPVERVVRRAPALVRSRLQALSAADYELLARQASPAVAVARAVAETGADGGGYRVRVTIIPYSKDPRPMPSFGLRRQVAEHLCARCPAAVAGQVGVVSPAYHPVGVAAAVVPADPAAAGSVGDAALAAVTAFLHPLDGGPTGAGWPFGRGVHLSDLARLLESVPGLDHLRTLELLVDGVPRGDVVQVPADRIVVAGPLRITLSGPED